MTMRAREYGRSNREWFTDPRGVDRQLQLTCHSDARRVVLSIWHDKTCAGTFQLPLEETPRLIAHLADCLSIGMNRGHRNTNEDDSMRVAALDRARAALEKLTSRLRRQPR